ncbi:hypothetical protein JOM56_002954 [Amanita muscaria]
MANISTDSSDSTVISLPGDGVSTLTYQLDPQVLVYRLDIAIAAFLCFIVLLRLPRGIGRFWRAYEWSDGHFLGYTRVRERVRRKGSTRLDREPSSKSRSGHHHSVEQKIPGGYVPESNESHTLNNHAGFSAQRLDKNGNVVQPSYPPHIVSCPALLRPLANFLHLSFIPPYSNLQLVIMMAYFVALFYTYAYQSNIFTDGTHAAWIAASQLPFVFAFAAKNNVLAWLLGLGYQHLNYLHRFAGRLVVIAANIHAIDYFYKWSLEGTLWVSLSKPSNVWGMVMLACFDIIFLSSLSIWRTKAYSFFMTTHFLCYVIIVPALYFHYPDTLPFIIGLSVPYCLDYLFRLLKTRVETAIIRPLPGLGATRIEIPSINSGWRAGQYVRIRVLSGRLGWFRWTESHPFTIASAPVMSKKQGITVGDRGLVLICKKTGTWTDRLLNMARRRNFAEMEAGGRGAVKVLIEGPYGGPGHAIFASYSSVVMVVGGSGITFGLSVIQDLVQKDLQAQSRVKAMHLIWMIQSPDAITPMLPLFTALVSSCPTLSISIYYTRAQAQGLPNRSNSTKSDKKRRPGAESSSASPPSLPVIPRGVPITLLAGRPCQAELVRAVEGAVAHAVSIGSGACDKNGRVQEDERGINGVLVGICGPEGLRKDVNRAVNSIDSARKQQVCGIEVFEETFGF